MTDWKVVKLDDVADLSGGYAFKSSQYTQSGRFVLRTVNIDDQFSITRENSNFIDENEAREFDRFALREHDTLFVMVAATLGKIGYVRARDLPALLNQNMWVIRAKAGAIDPIFLHYLFREISKIPLSWVGGSARSFLRRDDVRKLEFKLPDEDEQRAIANVLKCLDDKIELNRRMNETLEEMARALFRDWFVDFGPTRRQMEGATDPVAVMGGAFPVEKAATLAPLFPAAFGDDGLPEGWSHSNVGTEFDVVMGQSPPGHTYNERGEGLPFFQGRRDFGFRFPSRRVFCTDPKRVSESDWTLLSVRAPVGDINRSAEKCAIGRGVGAFLHKAGLHSFTYYTGLALRAELKSYDKDGTVFGSINQKQFRGLEVVVPDKGLAIHFDEVVAPMDDKIRLNTEESETLAEMRDLLLPKLMSGEVRVGSVEAAG